MTIASRHLDRASLEPHAATIFIVSILAIVVIFLVDLADGAKIWLHILYVFPIGALAFYCAGIVPVLTGVLLSLVFHAATLFTYGLPVVPLTANILIALAANILIAGLGRSARSGSIAMESLATTDSLTGLLNRRGFEKSANREIARNARHGSHFALAILDLNRFKLLNDSKGHHVGDQALRLVAEVLRTNIRQVDFAARIGGDEFAVMMPHTDRTACASLCRKLSSVIADRMADAQHPLTASLGYVCSEDAPNSSLMALMEKADQAMYVAKGESRGAIQASLDFRAHG